jgi:hypothetical protein
MGYKLVIACMVFCVSSFCYGQEKAAGLKDYFSSRQVRKDRKQIKSGFSEKVKGKESKKKAAILPDFYAKLVEQAAEHNQLPSFFSKAIEREKDRTSQPDFFGKPFVSRSSTEQPDHFGKPLKNKSLKEQNDFFGASVGQKQRKLQDDYFQQSKKDKRHSDQELTQRSDQRRYWRKNFIGEKWRIFDTDPNKKNRKETSKSNKTRDPFGRDARKMEEPQAPRNQMDLFDGGVMPKMKDLR